MHEILASEKRCEVMAKPNDRCFYVYRNNRYGIPKNDAVEPCNQERATHHSHTHPSFVEAPLDKHRMAELIRGGATHKDFDMVDGNLLEKQAADGAVSKDERDD